MKATIGQQGGYALARPPRQISIRELLEALEGNLTPVSCLTPGDVCEIAANCQTQRVWRHIDDMIRQTLESVSLQDVLSLSKKKRS
ncbi:MAG: hypothetical protein A2Z21_05930 [Candidatus Fraserbacteria bacterium RBG_16_55_9]|uniref:Rrf2 family transcriptional regulator n=1 Tax=Fraserbacteria sp. (strain RBG_16_55_9) TaxID=1817864 RepID=A0A1F5UYV9_FRAXR|nr:MAG: hypothetical protein A2Z21_05930 [Candidatus Fraserbacteria bacterium RBG_16_55_9]